MTLENNETTPAEDETKPVVSVDFSDGDADPANTDSEETLATVLEAVDVRVNGDVFTFNTDDGFTVEDLIAQATVSGDTNPDARPTNDFELRDAHGRVLDAEDVIDESVAQPL